MKYFLGIDIGTSGAKVVALAENGTIAAIAQQEYPLSTPQPLWAEQDPQLWWTPHKFVLEKYFYKSRLPTSPAWD